MGRDRELQSSQNDAKYTVKTTDKYFLKYYYYNLNSFYENNGKGSHIMTLGSAVQKSNRRTCAEECGRPFINRITHEHELKFITYS